jgi:hypothetical protein
MLGCMPSLNIVVDIVTTLLSVTSCNKIVDNNFNEVQHNFFKSVNCI